MPSAGYFVANNLLISLNVGLRSQIIKYEDNYMDKSSSTQISFGPGVRYFFSKSKVKPYIRTEFLIGSYLNKLEYSSSYYNSYSGGYGYVTAENNNTSEISFTIFEYDFGGGIAYFLTEHVALDACLLYSGTMLTDGDDSDNQNLTIGVRLAGGIVITF